MPYTRIVGDIHGEIEEYQRLVETASSSVQVGDFGVGFSQSQDRDTTRWQLHNPTHKFIRGNHDSPDVSWNMPGYLGNYKYDEDNDVLYISGAWSIDYYHRTEGLNWWEGEELSQYEFDQIGKLYLDYKPKVVISHDAPYQVPIKMGLLDPAFGGPIMTRTGYRLQQLFNQYQPKHWFFGHWHQDKTLQISGCEFTCLGCMSYVDFDFKTLQHASTEQIRDFFYD